MLQKRNTNKTEIIVNKNKNNVQEGYTKDALQNTFTNKSDGKMEKRCNSGTDRNAKGNTGNGNDKMISNNGR